MFSESFGSGSPLGFPRGVRGSLRGSGQWSPRIGGEGRHLIENPGCSEPLFLSSLWLSVRIVALLISQGNSFVFLDTAICQSLTQQEQLTSVKMMLALMQKDGKVPPSPPTDHVTLAARRSTEPVTL